MNRAVNWYGAQVPEWLSNLKGKDVNFMELSADQQCVIFLLDKLADPGAHLQQLVNAYHTANWDQVSRDNWATGHYKGGAVHEWRGKDGLSVLHRPPNIWYSWNV